jgi:hypothetical protein
MNSIIPARFDVRFALIPVLILSSLMIGYLFFVPQETPAPTNATTTTTITTTTQQEQETQLDNQEFSGHISGVLNGPEVVIMNDTNSTNSTG